MDSFQWHIDRGAFENDRRKTATLTAAGLRLTRSTWEQAHEEPVLLVAQIAQALSCARASA
jgi:hypothetical protein